MINYDFIGCAKRLGTVLIGRTEPSVQAVVETATEVHERAGKAVVTLRSMYNETVKEGVPEEFMRLLERLGGEHHVPN